MSKALVKNAADEEQVQKAEETQISNREIELMDLVDVLDSKAGRRLLWKILSFCGTEQTPYRDNDRLTYMAIGSGDVGRWLKAEIISAGEEFLFMMMKENIENGGEQNARSRRKRQ